MTTKAVKFWMVWSPQGNRPTYKHPDRASANNEAKRLSLNHPSQQFFVLKSVGGFIAIPVLLTEPEAIEFVPGDDIPF